MQLQELVSLVKLSIPDASGIRYFVTSAPRNNAIYTLQGTPPAGFKAFDVLHEKVVFLEDTWENRSAGHPGRGTDTQDARRSRAF